MSPSTLAQTTQEWHSYREEGKEAVEAMAVKQRPGTRKMEAMEVVETT